MGLIHSHLAIRTWYVILSTFHHFYLLILTLSTDIQFQNIAMATQPVLELLSESLPEVKTWPEDVNYEPVTNRRCPDDITAIDTWAEFNYEHMMQEYGKILSALQMEEIDAGFGERFWRSPFPNKATFIFNAWNLFFERLRPALQAAFKELASQVPESNLTPVDVTQAFQAAPTKTYTPDLAIIAVPSSDDSGHLEQPPNRAPGYVNVSWKWKSAWRDSDEMRKTFYLLGLSRAKLYMELCGTRYGFIFTNEEFVAIKRDDASGRLALSESIPWTSGGSGKMSLLLGLWYLSMFAAKPDWKLE